MGTVLHGIDASMGWLMAVEHLLEHGGKDVNLVVVIDRPLDQVIGVKTCLDGFLSSRQVRLADSVANTLFPQAFYRPALNGEARCRLYGLFAESRAALRRWGKCRPTYFDRLISWPAEPRGFNQLEWIIGRLRDQLRHPGPLSSAYELGVSIVAGEAPDGFGAPDAQAWDLRIQAPGCDRRTMGFPCLSHISLTLIHGCLHMTALYRNQHFLSKAYGNYVGHGRLLGFLCLETGCEPGELACIATHADCELGARRGFGRRDIQVLVEQCRRAATEPPGQDRPMGGGGDHGHRTQA